MKTYKQFLMEAQAESASENFKSYFGKEYHTQIGSENKLGLLSGIKGFHGNHQTNPAQMTSVFHGDDRQFVSHPESVDHAEHLHSFLEAAHKVEPDRNRFERLARAVGVTRKESEE